MEKIKLFPYKLKTDIEPEFIPQGVSRIGAANFWNRGVTGKGQVIAIIDSGCDIYHEDLRENIIGVKNFTKDDNSILDDVTDYIGHGTHVAGIISAVGNGYGIKGVAPDSKLLIIKVIDKKGVGSYKNLIKALDYAIGWKGDNGETVSVINLSLGGAKQSMKLYAKIKEAINKQIILVGAAGNRGDGNLMTDELIYPNSYKEVIQIGSVNMEGIHPYFLILTELSIF